jgi:hypothetical protein
MNRTLRRPMFRRGGSAEGITSGLDKPKRGLVDEPGGYAGEQTTKERLLEAMGQAPQGQNFNNFLINMGLDLVSRPKSGNIFQQLGSSAKEPFQKFEKASQAEQNLLRQVGLESATMDIGAETAAAAAALKEKSAMERLTTDIQAKKDLYDLERKDSVDTLIKTAAVDGLIQNGGMYNNLNTSTNAANWTYKESTKYKDKNVGGIISKNDLKKPEAFAKKQGKKQGVGTVYYDPYSDRVLEIQKNNEGDFVLVPISSPSEVSDKNIEAKTELGDSDGITNYKYPRGSQELLDQRKGLLDKGMGTIPEQQAGTSSYNIKMTPQQNRDYQEYLKQYKNR